MSVSSLPPSLPPSFPSPLSPLLPPLFPSSLSPSLSLFSLFSFFSQHFRAPTLGSAPHQLLLTCPVIVQCRWRTRAPTGQLWPEREHTTIPWPGPRAHCPPLTTGLAGWGVLLIRRGLGLPSSLNSVVVPFCPQSPASGPRPGSCNGSVCPAMYSSTSKANGVHLLIFSAWP